MVDETAPTDLEVPIVCPVCETRSRVPIEMLRQTIDLHNERRHGGEEVADVDPAIKDELASLVAEDLDLL